MPEQKLTPPEEILDIAFGNTWKDEPTPDGLIKLVLTPKGAIAFVKYVQNKTLEAAARMCDEVDKRIHVPGEHATEIRSLIQPEGEPHAQENQSCPRKRTERSTEASQGHR